MRQTLFVAIAVMVAFTTAYPERCVAGQPEFDFSTLQRGEAYAVFAGGCFWCMEPPFDKIEGVLATISGYTGGDVERPSYEIVTYTESGHYEALLVVYDPGIVSYEELLSVFWVNIDPVDPTGQFCDRGNSYRSAIFPANRRQRRAAHASKRALEETRRFELPVATSIAPLREFWVAEEYHQDYYIENAFNYRYYRGLCGRDRRLRELWGD